MANEEERVRQEKLASARRRVEMMKKRMANKDTGASNGETKTPKDATAADDRATAQPSVAPVDTRADDKAVEDDRPGEAPSTPSIAQQSKLRSTSFRAGSMSGAGPASPRPFSPEGDTAPDIYRKQVARIDELERENKKLSKENADLEKRWQKSEYDLAALRDAEAKGDSGELEKLKSEIASLQRQNSQLQQQVSRGSGHGHRPSVSMASPPADLQAELNSKSSTIESMEIEISTLKAQVQRRESGAESEREQVTALEEKLARAESAAGKAQRELQDLKREFDRTRDHALKEGSERSSAETKLRTMEHDLAESKKASEALASKADMLDKKVATLTTMHKEQDGRTQTMRKDKERAEKEASDLRTRVEKLVGENSKLKSKVSESGGGGLDDEGMDELENEDRLKQERKIRNLENEVHELRSGAWIEKRREMEVISPGFQEIDLSGGPMSPQRKKSSAGFGDFFSNGINALAGGDDELLEEEDIDFDEDAFRKAHEEEAQRRLERVREIKRGLKHWEGWRMDIVDIRRGGGEGIGDIFEV